MPFQCCFNSKKTLKMPTCHFTWLNQDADKRSSLVASGMLWGLGSGEERRMGGGALVEVSVGWIVVCGVWHAECSELRYRTWMAMHYGS